MYASVERTRLHLKAALDEQLRLYEAYVPSPRILAAYVRATKTTFLAVIDEVFEDKIDELTARAGVLSLDAVSGEASALAHGARGDPGRLVTASINTTRSSALGRPM